MKGLTYEAFYFSRGKQLVLWTERLLIFMEVKTVSKKEKIKKYLEEHENEVIMTIAGGITGVVMSLIGWHFGAKKALTDVADVFTKISKENGLDSEYKVIGNAIRGFDIVPKV